jgi:arylsulfatase A-like enzyme
MPEGFRENRTYNVQAHLFWWIFGACIMGAIEGFFCLITFSVLPVAGITSAFTAYVLFAVVAGFISCLCIFHTGRSEDNRTHTALSLFTAILVFFDAAIVIRRTPYLLGRIGQGIGLLVAVLAAAVLAFLVLRSLSRKSGRPVPFFLSSVILVHSGFLFLRYVNHYEHDSTIFYHPPAAYFNIAMLILFLPLYYVVFRFFRAERVERSLLSFRGRLGIAVLLLLTVLVFLGGRFYSPGAGSAPSSPNILLIVMDTTRRDFLSCYGHEPVTSPNIDSLAARGAIFENAIASAPWTVPTHGSMFTGLFPSSHGAHWEHMYLDGPINTAGELVRRNGYQTVGFSNNAVVGYATNFTQGFDDFYEMWKGSSKIPTLYSQIKDFLIFKADRGDAGAGLTNEMIKGWLERRYDRERPFFMFVNYFEPHLVYNPPVHYRKRYTNDSDTVARMRRMNIHTLYRLLSDSSADGFRLSEDEIKTLRELYSAEIAYLDSKIGEFIEYLDIKGYLEDTFLIITADHGDNLGEHNLIDHQLNLYDTLLRVPLIILHPTLVSSGVRIEGTVQSTDIFPTILEVAGIPVDEVGYPVQGKSLFLYLSGEDSRNIAYSEYMSPKDQFKRIQKWVVAKGKDSDFLSFDRRLKSVRTDTLKYIWSSDGNDELYKISSDPWEEEDIVGTRPGSVNFFSNNLEMWHDSLPRLLDEEEEIPEMDKETRDLLKALGYVD